MGLPVASTAEALILFGRRAAEFEARYRITIDAVRERVPQTTLCTIYNGNFTGNEAATTRVGLMLFNDAILRVAFAWGLAVIDLRLVCVDPRDYANPLEPSSQGAEKIARAITASLGLISDGRAGSVVTAG